MNFSHSFPCSFSKLWPCLLVFLPPSGQPQTTPQGQGRDLTDLTLIWQQATFRFREFITYMDWGRKSGTDASCQGLFLHTEQGVMGTSSLGSPIWTAASKGMGCHYNLKKVRPKPSHFIRSNETLCLDNLLGETESGVEDARSNTSSAPPINTLLGEAEVLLPGLWSLLWIFANLPEHRGEGIPLHFFLFLITLF